MNGQTLMELEALEIGYRAGGRDVTVIKNIDLAVSRGEVVCLMGQNGVGKSTLLRTIAGRQPPLQGKVRLRQRSIRELSVHQLSKEISLVLTDRISADSLQVEELVALGRHPHTNWLGLLSVKDRQAVEEAMTLTKINYLRGKRVIELSDGQYQKAMIARALAQDGGLMILDEPTAFLDLNNSVEIFLLLKKLAEEKNKAVIVSTHNYHLAMEFADRLWLANFNRPLRHGLPEDLALNGQLAESLYHEGFELDLLSGRVAIPHSVHFVGEVIGPGPAKEWTERAMEKWRPGHLAQLVAPWKITIAENNGSFTWESMGLRYSSIECLLHNKPLQ